jgi:hypothetical protein
MEILFIELFPGYRFWVPCWRFPWKAPTIHSFIHSFLQEERDANEYVKTEPLNLHVPVYAEMCFILQSAGAWRVWCYLATSSRFSINCQQEARFFFNLWELLFIGIAILRKSRPFHLSCAALCKQGVELSCLNESGVSRSQFQIFSWISFSAEFLCSCFRRILILFQPFESRIKLSSLYDSSVSFKFFSMKFNPTFLSMCVCLLIACPPVTGTGFLAFDFSEFQEYLQV